MSEALVKPEVPTDAIERYASFLEAASHDWLNIKQGAGIQHDQPGSRDAYRKTGDHLRILALEAGITAANQQPFVAGTQVILRYQFILATKSRELGLDIEQAVRFAHNYETYGELARIARQPRPIALALERQLALSGGLNPEEPQFWRHYESQADRLGQPRLAIPGTHDRIQALMDDYSIQDKLEDHYARHQRPHDGCDALRAGQLRPIQTALANIVVADPDLLTATLTKR